MPTQGVGITIGFVAYNTSTGAYQTGDAGNITCYLNKNGTIAAASNAPTEDDATHAKGQYSLAITNAEAGFPLVKVMGQSTTANVLIIPTSVGFEAVPLTVAAIATGVWQDATAGDFTTASSIGKSLYTTGATPGAANGLVIAGANAATTFATLTSTGALSINGVSDVAQTGDSFARIGALGAGLTALAQAATALSTAQWTNARAADLDNLDVTVSSRLSAASFLASLPANFSLLAIDGAGLVTYNNAAPPSAASITTAVLTTAMTQSYAALHAVPSLAQALFEMRAILAENVVVGTVMTVNKIDGVTPAETFTLNSATAPTALTRAT